MKEALATLRGSFLFSGLFSFFINLLMLTVPLYMLQIYDRVLGSRSESTLVALTVLAGGLLVVMGVLELIRSRVLVRTGARLDRKLNERVFSSVFAESLRRAGAGGSQRLRDLDTLRQFLTGNGPFALFDAPWMPVYLLVVFLFHPVLGWISTGGALLLLIVALLNETTTKPPLQRANEAAHRASAFAELSLRNAEVLEALGMMGSIRKRWLARHREGLALQALASDRAGVLTACSKVIRLSLQVAILGAGAALAIDQIITPGTMIAASIITARALAPVEQAIANWRGFVSARSAYERLGSLLRDNPEPAEHMQLPKPDGQLSVEELVGTPPGATRPVLHGISFSLQAGEALGVLGPTASGKSTLARHLVGLWKPTRGGVRLSGSDLRGWAREDLGPLIGYLPQDVELFDGSIAENVSRFEEQPDPSQIVYAAQRAGAHDMILQLPGGYDAQIGIGGSALSAGQRQRIGLARAIYGDPVLVVLDEPNSNLDADGDRALAGAIADLTRHGSTVVVMAHRPSAIASVDKLLVLQNGTIAAFGPKEEVIGGAVRIGGETRGGT